MAEGELMAAFNRYENIEQGLGYSLFSSVDASVAKLSRMPYLGTIVTDDVRRVLIKRFPYGIYYRNSDVDILVIGFRHFRQPKKSFN